MTPERWQQIQDVLEKALELAPEQRSAYLNQACSSDQSLRQEVETLLASSDHLRSNFLQSPPPPAALTSGTKVGEYEIAGLLGSGGMGEVYRARDARLGREVAVKVLPAFFAADSDRLRRFELEARAAAALNHPNILAVFQMGTHQGAPYLVSELLEGETLRAQLKHGRLAVRRAMDYGVQIAHGLAAAHEKGIVHRDLKPENLFVTKSGRVKILDFGLAKLTQRHARSDPGAPTLGAETEAGTVMGTVGYMAPEQVRGEAADHRADIFTFGAILYEMLAGTRAFQKPTSPETMTAILNEDPPGISQVAINLAPALRRVVHRCLEKKPEERFQSASDLAFALDALSESSGRAVAFFRKEAVPSGLLAFIREHKLGMAVGLALVGLVLAAVVPATRRLHSRNVPRARIMHKQFTFSGNAYEPAISPDGLFVAYVSRKVGEPQKLIVQASGGATLELVRGADIERPRWSPDGSEVLFFRREPELYKVDPSAKNWGISVVSRLGGATRPIRGGYGCWFAPDGSQIVTAFQAERSFKGIYLVNSISGEEKKVPLSEYSLLFDIDCSGRAGMILVVAAQNGKFQIRVFKPNGSEERKLVEESDEIYSARWSSAGDAIYYLHGEGSTKELSRVSVTSGNAEPTVLADGLQTGKFFTLSADGSRLAYAREDQTSNLWRVDLPAAGKTAKPNISRVTSGTSYYGAPSFSPDGHFVAFAFGPNPSETNLFKIQVAGGEPVQFTFFDHSAAVNPAWSPDGQRIAFISDQEGTPRVWIIGANGGTAQPLEDTNASDTNWKLAWSPSGDIVYQESVNRNFVKVNDQTHKSEPLIPPDKSVGWIPGRPTFSPDGKKVAIWWNRKPDVGLWIISFEPYAEIPLRPGNIFPFGWSPGGKYVYATTEAGRSGPEVVAIQVASPHAATSVTALPGNVIDGEGATVSPDGKEIYASVSEEKSDVWLMENFDPSAR